MSQNNPFATPGYPEVFTVDQAPADVRSQFIVKTYAHLALAIAAFVGIEAALLSLPNAQNIAEMMIFGLNGYAWLIVLGCFMAVSYVADSWARSDTSIGIQYLGLGLYVVAQAAIFMPMLYVANTFDPGVIPTAGLITLLMFFGLTAVVFVTKANLSFMGNILAIAAMAAFGLIVCSILFGFTLGVVFSVAMIALACGYILYDTSNILHVYQPGQHVAAALALFASVALLFIYVVRLLMALNRE